MSQIEVLTQIRDNSLSAILALQSGVKSYSIGGRSLTRHNLAELWAMYRSAKSELASLERVASGGHTAVVSFGSPR